MLYLNCLKKQVAVIDHLLANKAYKHNYNLKLNDKK